MWEGLLFYNGTSSLRQGSYSFNIKSKFKDFFKDNLYFFKDWKLLRLAQPYSVEGDIKVQCDVILNAWGRMRRARASWLYCNISFVKYSIIAVASHYTCDTVTFGPTVGQSLQFHVQARIFKQVQPVIFAHYTKHMEQLEKSDTEPRKLHKAGI